MTKLGWCGLALLPVLACSGDNNNFTDDGGDSSTDDGSGGDAGDESTPIPTGALATGIAISGLTVDQAVSVKVVTSGALATKNAPLVAGRKGLLRIFVTPGSGWTPHQIAVALTLHTAGQDHLFTAALTPTVASTEANMPSTFNFDVPAALFATDTTFFAQLIDPQGTGPGDTTAQFPNSGTPVSLGVGTSGTVKIYVIPINFTSYSAGTPATGSLDISAYQEVVMGLYPATNVALTVQPTFDYAGPVPTAQGSNWNSLLSQIVQLRAGDPTADVYYYGAFAPTASFASFCPSGCIAGLSTIPSSPANISQKASIGLMYGGSANDWQLSGQTMAHEVGHGHGRAHAPTSYAVQGCSQPSGIDPSFPYPNGAIGVWGYDITNTKVIDPTQYYDIMGYCAYDWISDYTYGALFQWVATDNGADMVLPQTPTTYRQVFDDGAGALTVGDAFPVYGAVAGTKRTVTYTSGGASQTLTGSYFPYDHLPGGYLLVPEPTAGLGTVRPTALHYAK